jgi:calcineurin-like phosphoesterase family protein
MRTFFTADHHFGHASIIEHCPDSRPFRDAAGNPDVDAMDRAMIDHWNAVVTPRDRVIHVGDFAHKCDPKRLRSIFARLHGQKFLVIGNHDDAETLHLPWAGTPQHILTVSVDGQRVVACHYAMRTWPGASRGALHVYGHSHGRLPGNSLSCDVGVDCWSCYPVDFPTIQARLAASPAPTDGEVDPEPGNDGGLEP